MHWIAKDPLFVRMLADRFAELCADPNSRGRMRRSGRELYQLLIAPVHDDLRPGVAVIIEADEVLGEVPFQALVDDMGNYLCQSHPITYVPGISYISLQKNAEQAITPQMNALIVVVSHGDAETQLPPLTDAVSEAQDVARHFSHPLLLIEEKASLHAVTSSLATLQFFISRDTAASRRNAWSFCWLRWSLTAVGVSGSGVAPNNAVHNLRLAVLPTCSTQRGPDKGILDTAGLSRAFLRRSAAFSCRRWDVDSAAVISSSTLSTTDSCKGRRSVRHSARQGQVRLLKPHPYYWAPFDAFGSN